MPFERNLRFTGRESELSKVETLLFQDGQNTKVAVTGLGGVGKTQLAIELVYRTIEKHKDCSVFWIPATDPESLLQAYLTVAQQLNVPGRDKKGADVKRLVQNYLSDESAGQWLLVFDNADDLDMWMSKPVPEQGSSCLLDYLPKSKQGNIVFTTRDRKMAVKLAPKNVVEMREMNTEAATELLRKYLVGHDLTANGDAAKALLTQLAFLPLAIVQATAYIKANGISIADYLALLIQQDESAIELLSEDFADDDGYPNIKNPVATTWLISFERIQQHHPLAADYLSFMACIEPNDIPQTLLPEGLSRKKETDAIGTLDAYSFITRRVAHPGFNLHRLVHLATRNWLKEKGSIGEWAMKTIRRLREVFPNHDHKNRAIWRMYLAHARYALFTDEVDKNGEDYTELAQNFGLCLLRDGRYDEAEKILLEVMKRNRTILGSEHPDTLTSMADLASTYSSQGRWKEAKELNMQVMDTRKMVLGEEHLDTLSSTANLASTYYSQGQWREAQELDVQVLDTFKRVLGSEHPLTLESMANLASAYWDQGRWKEAEALDVQVMDMRKRVLGKEHPNTLTSMANLASTYRKQGRWKEAEELNMQVMDTRKRVLGEEHPDTLRSIADLGSTYYIQGQWKEAEALDVQVMDMRKRMLGKERPDTLASMANLASTYREQGRWKEAEELFVQVVEMSNRVLGPEHPGTLEKMAHLALTYRNQGRWELAEELQVKDLQFNKRIYGDEHPETLMSMAHLAVTYNKQGRLIEARELGRQAMENSKRVLGAEHPNTLKTMNYLTSTYRDQRQWDKAEELGRQAMKTCIKVLGLEHPDTLASMHNLAWTWRGTGRKTEAVRLMGECVQLRKRILGVDHPYTLSSSTALAEWEAEQAGVAASA
jgi:tetratricopeptide (TPR) repeat protein